MSHIVEWSEKLQRRLGQAVSNTPRERLRLRLEMDALIARQYGLTIGDFAHVLSTFPLVDNRLEERRHTTLSLEAFRYLTTVGVEEFCRSGFNLPSVNLDSNGPGVELWEPEGGWDQAWRDARGNLSDDEWGQFTAQFFTGEWPVKVKRAKAGSAVGRPDSRQITL